MFRFLNILSYYFVYSVRWGSNFHSFACGYSVVLAYEKIIFFFIEWSWHFCWKSVVCSLWFYFWTLNFMWNDFFLLILYLLISTDIGQLLLLLIIVSWFVNNAHFSFPFFFVGDVGMEYGDKYL